jgi:glucose/arabinose dehydrogenase
VPEGFKLELFASDLKSPRMLHVTEHGDVLVSQPHDGSVLLLRDKNGGGQADEITILLDDLRLPHGIDSHDGWLYVAETDAIGRIAFDAGTGLVSGDYQRILTGLPSGEGHWTRTLRVGPDGWLYVTVGSSCNVCIEKVPERAAMLRLRLDGSDQQLYATGLRNSVGFDWSPRNGALYATENGRDWLGDDFPPDELNRIVEGGFYGWPYANGNKVPDPDFGDAQQTEIAGSLAPLFEFRAHNAPLGMTFLRRQTDVYQYAALVALHGSWNRSSKDGYKVVSLHWNEQDEIEARDFVGGFVAGESVYGRPVDVVEAADGVIYISDDYAGLIYRVTSSR